MVRNFDCELTDAPCQNPRCTKSFCCERPELNVDRIRAQANRDYDRKERRLHDEGERQLEESNRPLRELFQRKLLKNSN